MYDPIMRVLTVLEILQARDHVSGADLAARLEVDLRTVQRYIVRLRDLGIPVEASPGVGGAYRLKPGYRLPPLLLTNEEAFALSLGLRSLHSLGLSALAPATEGALAKLERVLPQSLRESLHTVQEVISMEPRAWVVPTCAETLLRTATAVRGSRRIHFAYRSHTDVDTMREVEPYAVLHADDRWYLIGNDLRRKALRTFRLDRMVHVEIIATTFLRPADFDARAHLAERMPFVQSTYEIDVWLDLPKPAAEQNFALWRVSLEEENGGTRVRCGRDTLDLFAAALLSLPCRIVVHQPPELRDTFRRLAQRAAAAAEHHG